MATANKNYLLLFLFLIFSYKALSQNNYVVVPKLNTTDLTNDRLIRNIFTGDFAAVDVKRTDPDFSMLLHFYVTGIWQLCPSNLPDDKVEITYPECLRAVETRNGLGTLIRTDCLEMGTHHTGVYASPAMYKAETTVDALQSADFLKTMFTILKQDNPLGYTANYDLMAVTLKQDMIKFFSMNSCNSAGMKRFEENLRRYALNLLPVVLEGSQTHRQNPGILLKNQHFEKLVDDLIADEANTWMVNTYVPNNITQLKIVSRDAAGRPSVLTAGYQYKSGRDEFTGSLTLTFIEGLPNCLYFSDYPEICRTANRRVVSKYANGAYVSQ